MRIRIVRRWAVAGADAGPAPAVGGGRQARFSVIAPVPDQRVLTPDRASGTGFTVTNAGNLARYWLAWIDSTEDITA